MLKFLTDEDPMEPWAGQRNTARQYDFMNSSFVLWQAQGRPLISLQYLCELNYYAVHLLSPAPGILRYKAQINVDINVPPKWEEVESLMANFLSTVQKMFTDEEGPITVAAYALWRLNWIHPFAQGNGRTSRALCYFLLCQKYDVWLPGAPILPELVRQNRGEYYELLADADKNSNDAGFTDLSGIESYLERLLIEQLNSVVPAAQGGAE